jgi:hypothetical protein
MNVRNTKRLGIAGIATIAMVFLGAGFHRAATAAAPGPAQEVAKQEIPAAVVMEPGPFADMLAHAKEKPAIVNVGVKFLYDSAHIPGSIYLGPGRNSDGIDALEKWAQDLPRNKAVVIYCGCCPWDKCPNIRPAYTALQKMGFTQIKVIHIPQDFATDWVAKGLPQEKSAEKN